MQERPTVPGIERTFASAPSLDTARRAPFSLARNWTPSGIEIFGHTISIDIPTGNLVVSTSDVAYPYYNFSLGISRKYDAQEQHMQLSCLRNYPNVNPKPHWFGNWQFAYEADVDEVWHSSYPELHVTSGVGANGLFEIKEPDFRRNQKDYNSVNQLLRAYGIPERTLAALELESNFRDKDFLLRTRRGGFQILAGRFSEETLVDDICADMWLFNPISGSGFRISSKYFFNLRNGRNRDVGFPLVVSKLVDALGHAIELKPSTDQTPFKEYKLVDGSGRSFQIILDKDLTFLDGLNPTGQVRKFLVSEVIDETKDKYSQFDYHYNAEFLLEEVTLPGTLGNRHVRYHYDDNKHPGILTAIENSSGAKVRFEYIEDPTDNDERLNPRLKIKKIIDPEGITFEYEYDHPNSAAYVTISPTENGEPDRRVEYRYVTDLQNTKQRYITLTEVKVKRGYDLDQDQIVERQADKPQIVTNRTEYTKDGRFNVEKEFDPLGRFTRYKYNDFNQLECAWDFDNHWTQYTYDIPANPSALDPRRYDLQLVTRENILHTADDSAPGRPLVEGLRNITKKYEYHRYNATNPADSSGDTAQSTHRVHKETDERDNVWTYTYNDATNNSPLSPTLIESPLGFEKGFKTEYSYNDRGERETVTDAEGNKHIYVYNSQGQIEKYTDPNGNSISLTYYEDGNWLDKFTDQLGKVTTFKRDVDGRIKKITDPVGDSVCYEYYKNGRLHKIIHHRPAVQQDPQKDPNDPAARIADYPKLETEFRYSPLGSLACLINPKGLKLILEYDEAGRLYQWHYDVDNFRETKYLYDAAGRFEILVDRKGQFTIYTYKDPAGFIKTIEYPGWNDGIADVPGKQVEYKKYDYLGRVLEVVDSEIHGSTEFSYDVAGNLVLRRDPDLGSDKFELNFSYDDDNCLEKIWDSKKEYELVLTLDNLGRPEILKDSSFLEGSIKWDYTYRKQEGQDTRVLNLFKRSSDDAGLISEFDYDAKNRLMKINHIWDGNPPIFAQGFQYRDDDLIESITDGQPNSFKYDGIKQLIFEGTGNLSSDYDEAGNRLYRVNKTSDPNPASNKYNDLNHLNNIPGNSASFEYDDNGNMLKSPMAGGLAEYYFDGTDRLRVIKTKQYEITYLYDQQGKLIERKVSYKIPGSSDDKTHFRYLFSKPIVVRRNDQPFSILTWDPTGILLRIQRQQPIIGATSYKHSLLPIYDGLREVIKLVDGDKNVQVELAYDPWGVVTIINDRNGLFEFWGYRGGLLDNVSGNILFGARWYSPEIGRWISEDPSDHSDPTAYRNSINLYAYAFNSPLSFTDITGLRVPENPRLVPQEIKEGIASAKQFYYKELLQFKGDTGLGIYKAPHILIGLGFTAIAELIVESVETIDPADLAMAILLKGPGSGRGAFPRGPRGQVRGLRSYPDVMTPIRGQPPSQPTLEQMVTPIGTETSQGLPGTMRPSNPGLKSVMDILTDDLLTPPD